MSDLIALEWRLNARVDEVAMDSQRASCRDRRNCKSDRLLGVSYRKREASRSRVGWCSSTTSILAASATAESH